MANIPNPQIHTLTVPRDLITAFNELMTRYELSVTTIPSRHDLTASWETANPYYSSEKIGNYLGIGSTPPCIGFR